MKKTILAIYVVLAGYATSAQDFVSPVMPAKESAWVDSVYNALTLEERIAQLIHIRAHSDKDAAYVDTLISYVKKFQVGGATFFQGGPGREAIITNRLQEVSKVPLMISMDAEWGLGMRLDSTMSFPFQMTLGAIQDEDLIYQMGSEIARQCRELGIHVNFAPVVDVNNNPANPVINFRSFGENKYNVARKGTAYMQGLQNGRVLSTAKHFPGHGDTGVDSHYELPLIDHPWERLDSLELYPFRELIKNGVGGFMIAHLSIPVLDDTPNQASTLSKPIVTSLLRDSLNFLGMTFTDALEMQGVAKYYDPGDVEKEAFKAGNDAMLLPLKLELSIQSIKQALRTGEIRTAELEQRVKRALRMKYRLGLNRYRPIELGGIHQRLNTGKADNLLRELFKASLTIVSDSDSLLPVKDLASKRIASVSIGKDQRTHFQETLSLYTKLDHFQLDLEATSAQAGELEGKLADYDLVIVGLHDNSRYPRNRKIYNDAVLDFYGKLAQSQTPMISVLFRNPYNLAHMPAFEAVEAQVVTYQDSWYSQHYAAQMIFGAFAANGTLPVSIKNVAPAGQGLIREGLGRFEYTIPESVGIDQGVFYAKVDSIVNLGLDSLAYPGGQVLMAKDGKVILHKAFGHQTYDQLQPVDKDDLYDFASITKITGPLPALMKLHDEDKFLLEATFSDYLPEFRRGNKKDLDFRNVLAHQSPLIPYILYWKNSLNKKGEFRRKSFSTDSTEMYSIRIGDNLFMYNDYRKSIYKDIRKSELRDTNTYLYSGLSFILYPEIIENLSSEDYETYLKANFYEPLGAHTLTYNPLRFFEKDDIAPTEYDSLFRRQQIQGLVHDEASAVMQGVSGNAGLFGNANDLAKLMEMYRRMGEYGGKRYISYPTMVKFTSCQYCESGNRRGLGFDRVNYKDPVIGFPSRKASLDSFGHSGFTGTFTWVDPENGTLLVFLSNRVYPTRANRKVYQLDIYESLHGLFYN